MIADGSLGPGEMAGPACPSCGGSRRETVYRSPRSGIVRCLDCGLMRRDPYRGCIASKCAACPDRCIEKIASPELLEARLRVDGRRATRIRALAGTDYSELGVLELGSGFGCLASCIADSAREYLGTEPSSDLYRTQLELFGNLAGRVVNAVFPDAGRRGQFDLVVAVDILQFANGPLEFLKNAASYLREGGLLYLEVPNEARLGLRAAIRRGMGLYRGEPVHHGHVNFFTKRPLLALARKAGLTVERLEQLSIAGDEDRMFLTLKSPLPSSLKALCRCARATKADLLLGLGNLVCLCRK